MARTMDGAALSRRRVLGMAAGALGVASAGLLAACGGQASTTGTSASSTAAATSSVAPATASSASSLAATTTSAASTSTAAVATVTSATTTSAAATASSTGTASAAASAAAPSGKGATLQLASRRTGGSDSAKAEQALYDEFSTQNPGVKVEINFGSDTEQVLLTHHAGGAPLDFVENDWGTWSDLASKQVIAELTPYFNQAKIPLSIFVNQAVQNYSLQNKFYGEPVSMSVDAIGYNVDLFDANGIDHPPVDPKDTSWTMEKFQAIAQKLTKGDGSQFGWGGSANGYNTAGITNGTYFGMPGWDDPAQKSRYDAPEWSTGAQYWLDMTNKFRVNPTSDQAKALRGNLPSVFASGKIGMDVVYAISWTQVPFKWALATMPYSGKGDNISGRMYPHGLHMEASSPNKDQVWAILQWLTKPENGGRYPLIAGHSVSPLVNGGSDLAQKTRQQQWGVDPKAFLLMSQTLLPSGTGILKYANWPNIAKDQLTPLYTQVTQLKMTPQDYGTQAAKIVNDNIFKTS